VSLSLQMKKFINSEHVGNYVEITLPGLPRAKGEEPTPETVKIHYCEAGVGEPLILIHTVGQSLYTWRKVFDALAQHYRVIAIDLLGHGYSSRPLEFAYTIEEQSEALRLFMNAIGIRSAHIVGFSMGALYALDFVANNPDRVGKVVLLSPGGLTLTGAQINAAETPYTAEITGIHDSYMAWATRSSLNAHRSSMEPPPRPTISRSAN